ncbi:MAG: winged helix-turn-helix transcriptional regulator [Thermomicrobiales bacterium]
MSNGGAGKGATIERRHGETRREILETLRRSAGLTADQLAETLGVTAMAIRKHLAALQSEELLTAQIERRPIGRPVYLYALAPTNRATSSPSNTRNSPPT